MILSNTNDSAPEDLIEPLIGTVLYLYIYIMCLRILKLAACCVTLKLTGLLYNLVDQLKKSSLCSLT